MQFNLSNLWDSVSLRREKIKQFVEFVSVLWVVQNTHYIDDVLFKEIIGRIVIAHEVKMHLN